MKKLILLLVLTGLAAVGCGDDQKTQRGTVAGSAANTTTSAATGTADSTGPVWLLNPGS